MTTGMGEFLKLAPGVEWLIEKPLRLAVLYEMATRAMKNPHRVCFMSKWEFKKFSLKSSQKNQIERVLHDLEAGQERAAYIQRTGRKDEESGAVEYKLIDNRNIDTSKTSKNSQRAADGPQTGQERAETKEKSRYNKKEIYKEKILEFQPDQPHESSEEPLQSSAKVSPLCQRVIDLGKTYNMAFIINNIQFATIESKYPDDAILKKADDMFLWCADNKKNKPTSSRLLFFLRNDRSTSLSKVTTKENFSSPRTNFISTPNMQKINPVYLEAINAPKKETQMVVRMRSINDRFQKIGKQRGVTIEFNVPSLELAKIDCSDEDIINAGLRLLDAEVRRNNDAPIAERRVIKEFKIKTLQLVRELEAIQRLSKGDVVSEFIPF